MRDFFSMGVVVSALELLQNGGEFMLLGIWGILLAVCRRRVFQSVCREAALEGGEKGRMLRAMTLKFQKSYEVHVEISDRDTFVRKYICQEKRMRVSLPRWRYLPERLAGIILCVGAVEVALLDWLGYGQGLTWQRGTMALGSAAVVLGLALLLEVDSLWEQIHILLLDYVSNTLYPRQIHVYEAFEEETMVSQSGRSKQEDNRHEKDDEKDVSVMPVSLKKEEEKIFQEVLSDFLG